METPGRGSSSCTIVELVRELNAGVDERDDYDVEKAVPLNAVILNKKRHEKIQEAAVILLLPASI